MFSVISRRFLFFWAFSSILILSWGIFSWPLLTRHEARRAEIVRESLDKGTWLIPSFQDQPYVTKPPLFTWQALILAKLCGLKEGILRLPALLSAVFSLLLVFFLTQKELGAWPALWATLALFSTHKFFLLARRVELEIPFAALCFLALALFWLHLSRKRLLYRYLAFLVAGLAFLTKGPLAFIIFPALPVFAFLRRQKRAFWAFLDPLGWLIFFGVGLSWYLYAYHQVGPGPFHEFIYVDLLGRVKHTHRDPFYQYLLNLLANSLPASLILLYRPRAFLKERIWAQPFLLFFFLSVTVPVFLLSFTAQKFSKYLLALYPSWAIVLGAWWVFFLEEKKISLEKASYLAAGLALLIGLGHVLAEPKLNQTRLTSLKTLFSYTGKRPLFLYRFYDPALSFYYPELKVLNKPEEIKDLPPGSLILVREEDSSSLVGLPLKERAFLKPFLRRKQGVLILEKLPYPENALLLRPLKTQEISGYQKTGPP